MFEVGQRVIRGSNGVFGFIHSIEKRRTLMLEVRWDKSETKQWIPATEVRVWDKITEPVVSIVKPKAVLDDETLLQREKDRKARREFWENKKAEKKLADALAGLSNKRKARSRRKAKILISKFEKKK